MIWCSAGYSQTGSSSQCNQWCWSHWNTNRESSHHRQFDTRRSQRALQSCVGCQPISYWGCRVLNCDIHRRRGNAGDRYKLRKPVFRLVIIMSWSNCRIHGGPITFLLCFSGPLGVYSPSGLPGHSKGFFIHNTTTGWREAIMVACL